MAIKKISIIGLGLIGGSIAKALSAGYKEFNISGFDKPEVIEHAFHDKAINEKLPDINSAKDADLIFLCLPSQLSLETFDKLLPLLNEDTIISDVCGVKGIFEDKWKAKNCKGLYIGGHPMTGKEKGGYENSDPLLFENSVYVLSDTPAKDERMDGFVEVVKKLGARIRYLNPYIHDKVISRVSHLPQLISIALVNSIPENGNSNGVNFLDFAAGGFRDMTRIASSAFDIWEPIFKFNREEIINSIEIMHKNLNKIEDYIECEDFIRLGDMFSSARTKRDEIPKNTKGFINPLFDVFVYVKDEPGVLSKLTTLLFQNSINIKDMELLKIREGTGGTFRLSFDSESAAKTAKILIENSGFATK